MRRIFLLAFLLLASQSYALSDLIQNGNFSAPTPVTGGIPNWITSTAFGAVYNPCLESAPVGTPSASGVPWAIVGSTTPFTDTFTLQQRLYIPPDTLGNTMALSFAWNIANWAPTFDWVEGRFQGLLLFHSEPSTLSQPVPTPGWTSISPYIPLENYRNTTVTVSFSTYSQIGTGSDYMYVDDVKLFCDIATKTVTPTVTMTATITKTATISPTPTKTATVTCTYTITPTITQTLTVTPWVVSEGDVMAFPNPANGNQVNFMYSPTAECNVSIEIYNLAGMKVAKLEDRGKLGRANQITTWNIQGVAPGIYLFRVVMEGISGASSSTKMKKLVITK